ncbi:hypothetical protein AD006_28640 (plasmid) [Pseudonocardia sp. EC080610-09]|nr:hypothetical protein AD006_28640 [Pseudonocardia sp. EC080610-09]ALL85260.1 hypothetical protein AD017_29030 [Pseudonocardia sp. EC080619-01]
MAAELIAVGLRCTERLPTELPPRLSSTEAADFTARIPAPHGKSVRAIARARDSRISIVAGALITIGLRHTHEPDDEITAPTSAAAQQDLTHAG